MRLNQKVRYGVACLFELSKYPGEYLGAEELSSRQNIPFAYAQKVLQAMAQAGLVFAQKGVGYKLARPLVSITALEVIETLTKDVETVSSSPSMGLLLEQRIEKVLGAMTLGEITASR